MWEYNLDREVPEKKTDGFVLVTEDLFVVFENDEEILREALSDVKEFKFTSGVGCVFAEYTPKCGEPMLISRADCREKSKIAMAVKAANRFLHYDQNTFHKYAPPERVCPKCGRAYRQGSETCLTCFDGKKIAKRLWGVASPYKWLIIGSMLLFVVISLLELITPRLTRILTDDYILSEEPVKLLHRGCSSIRNWLLILAGNKVVLRLRSMLFEKVQRLSIARISKRTAGELMNRISNDTGRIRMFIVNQLSKILEQALLFLVVGTVMFIYDWKLALFILLPTPLIAVAFYLFRGIMGKLFRRSWERQSQSNTVLHDIFSGIRVVKSYGMEHREAKRFESYALAEKRPS